MQEAGKFALRQGMVESDGFMAQVDQEEGQPGLLGEAPEVL
jgi:hypothetical protein